MTVPSIIGSGVTAFAEAASSATIALNIPATGSNRCLVVATFNYHNFDPPAVVSGVTYNGVALTGHTPTQGVGNDSGVLKFWRLLNPGTGSSFNIVATCDQSTTEVAVLAAAFQDVDQTTPFGTAVGSSGTASTTSTGTVTLAADDLALAAWSGYHNGTYTITPNGTGIVEDENNSFLTTLGFQSRTNATLGWTHSLAVSAFQQLSVPLKGIVSGPALILPITTPRLNTLLRM